jgi:hypothetical protein
VKDLEDLDLKAEIDEIMRSVDSIMKKVEAALWPRPGHTQRVNE